jgi:MFS family permease
VSERLLTRPFVLAFAATFFHGMAWALFIHLPGHLEDLGAGEVEIGAIIGFAAVASVAIRPWVGRLSDRRGRRLLIIIGNAINLGSVLLYFTVEAIDAWVYSVRIIQGLSEAVLFTSLFTLAADWVPATKRTQGLALFGVGGMLPIGLAGVLGDAILERSDFNALFWAAAGFALASLALSLPLQDAPHLADRPRARGFFKSVTSVDLLPIWWITFMFSFVLTAYFTFLRTWVDETGIGSVGLFFAAYSFTAIGLRLLAGWLPDRVGPKRVLFPALGCIAAGLVVLSAATGNLAVGLAGVLCGGGHGYTFPILYGMTVTRARVEERGSAMSVYTGLFDLATLVGGPILGLLIVYGSYNTMFVSAALLLVAATVLYWAWDRPHGGVQPTTELVPEVVPAP